MTAIVDHIIDDKLLANKKRVTHSLPPSTTPLTHSSLIESFNLGGAPPALVTCHYELHLVLSDAKSTISQLPDSHIPAHALGLQSLGSMSMCPVCPVATNITISPRFVVIASTAMSAACLSVIILGCYVFFIFTVLTIRTIIGTVIFTSSSHPPCTDYYSLRLTCSTLVMTCSYYRYYQYSDYDITLV
jgi:hypothetical protein